MRIPARDQRVRGARAREERRDDHDTHCNPAPLQPARLRTNVGPRPQPDRVGEAKAVQRAPRRAPNLVLAAHGPEVVVSAGWTVSSTTSDVSPAWGEV